MKVIVRIIGLLTLAVMLSLPTFAVAKEAKTKGEVVMKVGGKVHLFHSGTADVKKEICINDVIPVYRETMGGSSVKSREVGQVKVIGYAGEHYFDAEIVKGEIKVGDIAKKNTASCLVQPVK